MHEHGNFYTPGAEIVTTQLRKYVVNVLQDIYKIAMSVYFLYMSVSYLLTAV